MAAKTDWRILGHFRSSLRRLGYFVFMCDERHIVFHKSLRIERHRVYITALELHWGIGMTVEVICTSTIERAIMEQSLFSSLYTLVNVS